MGVGRSEDGRLLLLEAPLALFPGEVVEAKVLWKARHGEGRVTRWLTRDPRRAAAACAVSAVTTILIGVVVFIFCFSTLFPDGA